MIIELDLDFMAKHKITAEQFMVLYILEKDDVLKLTEEERKRAGHPIIAIYKYTQRIRSIPPDSLKELEAKGFLKLQKRGTYKPDEMEVTDKFKREVFAALPEFDQLYQLYPPRLRLDNGKQVPLKILDKPDSEMADIYTRVVNTKKKHEHVMAITEWAKERGLLKMGIAKYIYSRAWEWFEDSYEKDEEAESYDIDTLI